MDKIVGEVGTIAAGIIGLAIIAVLVGSNARTGEVITSAGRAFAGSLEAAMRPVTGGGFGVSRGLGNL